MSLARARAAVHPGSARLSSCFACASAARNAAQARAWARLIEAGVGSRSSCAPIDWGAIGPAYGFRADWRTACSNWPISDLHGPACADEAARPAKATTRIAREVRGFM